MPEGQGLFKDVISKIKPKKKPEDEDEIVTNPETQEEDIETLSRLLKERRKTGRKKLVEVEDTS